MLAIIEDASKNDERYEYMILNEKSIIKEIRKIVTDTNLISLSVILEEIDMKYPSVVAACYYANKLELLQKHSKMMQRSQPENIERLFY